MPPLSLVRRAVLAVAVCSSLGAQTRWTTLAGAGPGSRSDVVLAYDAGRDRMVLTGGWDGTNNLADVWEFDGTAWLPRTAAGGPGPHSSHALAYDAGRQRVLLFGGWDGVRILGETWEWDGAASTWTQRTPAVVPAARYGHQLAYDSARQRVVMFGGYCGTGCVLADTWEWDGAAGTWTQRSPAISPPGRYSFGMCFDEPRQRVLLFGGRLLSARSNDTWEWDGGAGTWSQLTPAGVLPPPRSTHDIVFDTARHRVVLFGGFTSAWVNDTWEWDGIGWQQRTPAGAPSGRGFYGFAYDSTRGRSVIYGGDLGAGPIGGTLAYEPTTPARTIAFGTGCPSRVTTPSLRASRRGLAWLGTTITLETFHLAAASPGAALAIGTSATSWRGIPLPFDLSGLGMTGCTLWVSAELLLPAPVQAGVAEWPLTVPSNPSLLGVSVFGQGFAVELNTNPLGAVATNALRLELGGL